MVKNQPTVVLSLLAAAGTVPGKLQDAATGLLHETTHDKKKKE